MEHFIQKKQIFTDFRSLPLLRKCRHAVRSILMSLPFHLKSHTLKFSEVPKSWPGINHLAAGFFQTLCNPQIGHWGLFWTASGFCWHQYTLFSTTSETLSYVNLSGESAEAFEHDDLPRFTWCQTRRGNLRRKFTEKPWILSSMRLSHSNRWQLNFMSWLSTICLFRFHTARLSIRRSCFPVLTTIAFQNTTRWNQR